MQLGTKDEDHRRLRCGVSWREWGLPLSGAWQHPVKPGRDESFPDGWPGYLDIWIGPFWFGYCGTFPSEGGDAS